MATCRWSAGCPREDALARLILSDGQDKKIEPSSLATYVLARPKPRACREGGIGRADKTMYSRSSKLTEAVTYLIGTDT
jgi:hypothetical protein